ncbi:hypothetical protein ACWEFL_26535 [Streptomyces sp. NPDC004838]
MTADSLTGEPPALPGTDCCHCGRLTTAPVAVRWVPRPSGAGTTLYACPDCAPGLCLGPTPGELDGDA